MWVDIMTKPMQGTEFREMRAELMNRDVNYEDPPEEEESESVLSPKTVSWKSIVSTTFKTPQECVNLGVAHGAMLMTTRGDSSMITLEELLHVAKGGSARIKR